MFQTLLNLFNRIAVLALFLLFPLTAMAQADETVLKETATRFFLNLAEENGKDVTQQFELTDAMRTWLQGEQSIATVQALLRPFGGIGEIQKIEIVWHDVDLQSVELFYSGTKRPFKARVTFEGNQVAGIHLFPLQAGNLFRNMSVTECLFGGFFWSIILIPMFIASLFLLKGKGAFLIAGYNTMSRKERAKYDEKALCRATGKFMLWIICCTLLLAFAVLLEDTEAVLGGILCVSGIIVVSSIVFLIYGNTGNRFLKPETTEMDAMPETECEKAVREKQEKKQEKFVRWLIGITLFGSFIVTFASLMLVFGGTIEPTVKITDSGIRISGTYGVKIDFTEITDISLLNNSVHGIGLTRRTNGIATDSVRSGYWESNRYGSVLLFTRTSSSPTIHIERKDKPDVFLNFSDNEKTRALYAELKTAFEK